jgi:ABC-2 type transport system permease protein
MIAIFERELKSFFTGITGYIFGACLLIFAGIYSMVLNLSQGYNSLDYVFGNMGFIYLLAIPILTMRTIAEERKQKTDQLLYSLPISMHKIVLGKYFAMLVVLAVPIVIMAFYPLIYSAFGTVSYRTSYSTLIALYFLGAALTAMGIFISSLTDNQVVAAVMCLILMVINYFISSLTDYASSSSASTLLVMVVLVVILAAIIWYITRNIITALITGIACEAGIAITYTIIPTKFAGLMPTIIGKLSLYERFYNFTDGLFDITALVYFIMVAFVFVFLTVQAMEKRRWS